MALHNFCPAAFPVYQNHIFKPPELDVWFSIGLAPCRPWQLPWCPGHFWCCHPHSQFLRFQINWGHPILGKQLVSYLRVQMPVQCNYSWWHRVPSATWAAQGPRGCCWGPGAYVVPTGGQHRPLQSCFHCNCQLFHSFHPTFYSARFLPFIFLACWLIGLDLQSKNLVELM